ncbi:hypothetical protein HHI36_003236 [Cryptolaemus montrouzieri]|uniref:Uncharacterized protein n=1 Tax=Cryptolaemus montrouzieri TaxID=559131 RepID=A0ABD2PDE6_9CUCU
MFLYFYESYEAFDTKAVSYVTETAYLHWNTSFPAISICEVKGAELNYVDELEEASSVDDFVHDLAFFTGDCYTCGNKCDECDKLNFTAEVEKKRKTCTDLIRNCKWNDREFNCCKYFQPLETEYGICFALNSIHTKAHDGDIDFISNRKNGAGGISFRTTTDVRMYIHPTEDVPFINADPDLGRDILVEELTNVTLNVIEIDNDENVENIPIRKRSCRFPWEIPNGMKVHKYYSYSSCIVQCRVDAQLSLCGCTHHFMPMYIILNALRAENSQKPGLLCECVPSCNEPEYKIVSESRRYADAVFRPEASQKHRRRSNIVRVGKKVTDTADHPNTKENEVFEYIKFQINIHKCESLDFRNVDLYASFKLTITEEDDEKVLSPDFRPTGVCVRKFFLKRMSPISGDSQVNVNLQSLPTQRFKRIVTRTTMDLVGEHD